MSGQRLPATTPVDFKMGCFNVLISDRLSKVHDLHPMFLSSTGSPCIPRSQCTTILALLQQCRRRAARTLQYSRCFPKALDNQEAHVFAQNGRRMQAKAPMSSRTATWWARGVERTSRVSGALSVVRRPRCQGRGALRGAASLAALPVLQRAVCFPARGVAYTPQFVYCYCYHRSYPTMTSSNDSSHLVLMLLYSHVTHALPPFTS